MSNKNGVSTESLINLFPQNKMEKDHKTRMFRLKTGLRSSGLNSGASKRSDNSILKIALKKKLRESR